MKRSLLKSTLAAPASSKGALAPLLLALMLMALTAGCDSGGGSGSTPLPGSGEEGAQVDAGDFAAEVEQSAPDHLGLRYFDVRLESNADYAVGVAIVEVVLRDSSGARSDSLETQSFRLGAGESARGETPTYDARAHPASCHSYEIYVERATPTGQPNATDRESLSGTCE